MKIAIIHPWLPQYRLEFFEMLVSKSADLNMQIDVFYGSPPPEVKDRKDSIRSQVAKELPTRFVRIAGQFLNYKSLTQLRPFHQYDLIILEQGVRNLETYQLLLAARGRIAFWGHGRTYTKKVPYAQEWLKERITRRGVHFFSYTQGGANHLTARGFDSKSITILNNTVDTKRLAKEVAGATDEDVAAYRNRWSLTGPTAMFIGGLDESKRLDFLLQACDLVSKRVDGFSLVVAGTGSQAAYIKSAAAAHSWLKHVGPLFGHEKAVAIKSSDVFAMPGRVGLVAVDSLATGRPIVTTNWNYHAPEFEYLVPGANAVVTGNTVDEYADQLSDLLMDTKLLELLSARCLSDAAKYSIEIMVDHFIEGLSSYKRRNSHIENTF